MAREKKPQETKKVRQSVTISPELIKIIKDNHINLSSLVNKLLFIYFNDTKKNM